MIASEGAAASEVARMYPNIEHVLVDTAGRDLLGTMRTWTDAMSEPVFNPVNYLWLTAILDRARERGIGVMLEGVGGKYHDQLGERGHLRILLSPAAMEQAGEDDAEPARARVRFVSVGVALLVGGASAELVVNAELIADNDLRNIYSPLINPELARAYGLEAKIFANRFYEVADPVAEQCRSFGSC